MPSTLNEWAQRAINTLRGLWKSGARGWNAWRMRSDETSEGAHVAALQASESSRRWQAAAALGRNPLRGAEAINALVDALADPEQFVRWEAAEALAGQDAGGVFQALKDALNDPDPVRRAGAAEALGQLGGEAAGQTLVARLGDPVPAVRAAVAGALGQLADPTAAARLFPLLDDPEPDVVRATARALSSIGDTSAAVPLAQALSRSGQPLLVRRALAAALVHAPHPDAQPQLLDALADPDPQVRAYAAEALGHVGNEAAQAPLHQLVTDRNALIKGTVGDRATQALAMLERRGRRAAASSRSTEAS